MAEVTVEITLENVENDWRHREGPHGNRVPRILHERVDPLGQEVTQESNREMWIHAIGTVAGWRNRLQGC